MNLLSSEFGGIVKVEPSMAIVYTVATRAKWLHRCLHN